jgi:pimeloyl-ACP methyl ester carboxylesterase
LAANDGQDVEREPGSDAEHAVFLVPGLLGFENFSTFRYFGDRVVAALRAGLEQRLGQAVPVIALPIPPTASLAERQKRLVRTLADRLHALEHGQTPLSVHLVGHSTGGLDANLLTQREPVGGGQWSDVDPRAFELQARIRTVISIASPHQGACIVRDPVARLLGRRDPRGVPGLLQLLARFGASALKDVEVADLLNSSFRELGKTKRFIEQIFSTWGLLDDLEPSRTLDRDLLLPDVLRRSFVTVAGHSRLGEASIPAADSFYRDLSARASGRRDGSAEVGPLVHASLARLKQALASDRDELLICAPGIELPIELDTGHNDGVVNAARQLMDPSDPDELAGIVAGDHFDVVGYYDRHVWTLDDEGHEQSTQLMSGLLHSGSGFRDDQFFELYRRVAGVIARAASRSSRLRERDVR